MNDYNPQERKVLLQLASDSINYTLEHHRALTINCADFTPHLQQNRACFVSLHLQGSLRGCIGTLVARQPLVADVAENAYNAAFKDPRFKPVSPNEVSQLSIEISVLSPPQSMSFQSEADLLEQLRPGIDGLILSEHGHRGTFLPVVWEQLPDPSTFLAHLKNKAGLPTNYWSNTIKIDRYTAELIA